MHLLEVVLLKWSTTRLQFVHVNVGICPLKKGILNELIVKYKISNQVKDFINGLGEHNKQIAYEASPIVQ